MCFEFTGRMRRSFFNGTVPEELVRHSGGRRTGSGGTTFSGMHLIDVGFRTGIDLSLQHLPTGEQYVYLPDAERARERVVASGRVRTPAAPTRPMQSGGRVGPRRGHGAPRHARRRTGGSGR
jgi:hypothetical protein